MKFEPENAETFFQNLVAEVPEFSAIYDEHISFNDGLIPYPLMDEFARFFVEECKKSIGTGPNRKKHRDVFTHSVNFLEKSLEAKDAGIELMIRSTVSETIDSLWREKSLFSAIIHSIGPRLRSTISLSASA
jgi:hypothetical protein